MSLPVFVRRTLRIAAFIAVVGVSPGCAAISASANLVAADKALGRAEEKNAPELAVYEYTMAVRHYEKAREEVSYNKYKDATILARASADWADKSIIAIDTEGLDVTLDRVGPPATVAPPGPSPEAAPPPTPPPTPAPTAPPASPLPVAPPPVAPPPVAPAAPPEETKPKIIVVPVSPPPAPAPAFNPWEKAP